MEIIKIAAFVLITLFVVITIRKDKAEMATLLSIVASVSIFLFLASKISSIVNFIEEMSHKTGIELIYIEILLKILGISYITSFASEVCRDAGENSLANRMEFAGKILILFLSIPILLSIFESIMKLL